MRKLWLRLLLIVIGALLVCLAIPVGLELYQRHQAQRELDEVVTSLDQADPRWRLEHVEADRIQVAPEKNSAVTIAAAASLLPAEWKPETYDEVLNVRLPVEFTEEQADRLTKELQAVAAAVQKARLLKDQPVGRHPLKYTPNWIETLVPHVHQTRTIASLLELDVRDSAHRKDIRQAWESSRALLNSGRSLVDEPLLISVLVRIAIDAYAINSLERALAQGEFLPAQLQEMQEGLEEEAASPLFLPGIRGERAGIHLVVTNIASGKISIADLATLGHKNGRDNTSWADPIYMFFAHSMVLKSHATILRRETEMVEAAKQPPAERYTALMDIDDSVRAALLPNDRSQILARLLLPAVVKLCSG
jgi:hypothetical protein